MDQQKSLAEQFQADRTRLRAVAYRMLGSLSDADDAVQETWLRLGRSGGRDIDNLSGWLTTVVARVCLDMLRLRKSRREDPFDGYVPEPIVYQEGTDAEREASLAESVGLAMLVVLKLLAPPERLAFVLHDMFAVPFDDIAAIVGRSPTAARQLASRARRRVQGAAAVSGADLACQREIVDAFLAASRNGDFAALLALLDPDVELRADRTASPEGKSGHVRGALAVARGARAFAERARFAQPALVNGAVGIIVAPRGRLRIVLDFDIRRGRIVAIDVIADPERLRAVEIAVLSH
jgi:RNA polymerase sigma factor (sigma-70 family)